MASPETISCALSAETIKSVPRGRVNEVREAFDQSPESSIGCEFCAKDFKGAHISKAVNIPTANLQGRMGELEAYKEKPVIVVCRMGTSASAAVKQLRAAGFSQAQRMAGGMMTWDEQRLPVTKK